MNSETSNTVLLCGPSVRAFARSAAGAGYRVAAVDDYCDLDLIENCEQAHRSPENAEGFERLFAEVRPLAWSYGGGWENRPGLVRRLTLIAPLWGMEADALSLLRDPLVWTAVLRDAGFLVPETLTGEDARQRAHCDRSSATTEKRWLSKSAVAAGGSHVRFADDATADGASNDGAPAERRFLQEFVPGHVESAAYVAGPGGVRFLGACRQIVGAEELGATGFLFAGAVGPLPLTDEEQAFFARLGQAVRSIGPIRGLFGVDGIRRSDGRWLPIEINPRYTASMETLERASGRTFFADHAVACDSSSVGWALAHRSSASDDRQDVEQRSALFAPSDACGATVGQGPPYEEPAIDPSIDLANQDGLHVIGKAIVYAQAELRLSLDMPAWREFERTFPGVTLADLPQPGTVSRPGEPVLTILVAARSPDEARAALLSAGRRVHAELLDRFGPSCRSGTA